MVAAETDAGATTMNSIEIPVQALEVLHELASAWGDVADPKALEVVPMSYMVTNQVFQVRWMTTKSAQDGEGGEAAYRKVLLRIYGAGGELSFDRDDEIRTFEAVARQGKGPRLLGTFPTGRVEEFINGKTLSATDLREPKISAMIAAKLREFHCLDMPGPKKVMLWDRLKYWLNFAKMLSSPEVAKDFMLDKAEGEISSLENKLSSENQKIGFCHNDLHYGNIIMDEEQLILIDYEYACYSPVAFDIANYFCEMTTNFDTETPHIADYNKYPDLDERKRFVQMYLRSSGEDPTDVEVQNLLQDIEKYVLASHWWNILYCIISIHLNDIGFDYIAYARQRFQQYWLRKIALLD